MNSPTVLLPVIAYVPEGGSLTPDQRIAIDDTRSPGERAEALFLSIGPQLGRYLGARHPLGTLDIAGVVSTLWITVLGDIGGFRNEGTTGVEAWHRLCEWMHALALDEARARAKPVGHGRT